MPITDYVVQAPQDLNTLFDNAGASTAVRFTLPPLSAGLRFGPFYNQAGQIIRLTASGADTFTMDFCSTGDATSRTVPQQGSSGFSIKSTTAGSWMSVMCMSTTSTLGWFTIDHAGLWVASSG